MILQTFVAVLIRIYALYAVLNGVSFMARFGNARFVDPQWFFLIMAALYLIAAGLLWLFSAPISRAVCSKLPPSLAPVNSGLADLYSFAFVLVGLYMVSISAGSFFGWFYYLFAHPAEHGANYYECFNATFQFILGVTFVFGARNFSIRLAKKHTDQTSHL